MTARGKQKGREKFSSKSRSADSTAAQVISCESWAAGEAVPKWAVALFLGSGFGNGVEMGGEEINLRRLVVWRWCGA